MNNDEREQMRAVAEAGGIERLCACEECTDCPDILGINYGTRCTPCAMGEHGGICEDCGNIYDTDECIGACDPSLTEIQNN